MELATRHDLTTLTASNPELRAALRGVNRLTAGGIIEHADSLGTNDRKDFLYRLLNCLEQLTQDYNEAAHALFDYASKERVVPGLLSDEFPNVHKASKSGQETIRRRQNAVLKLDTTWATQESDNDWAKKFVQNPMISDWLSKADGARALVTLMNNHSTWAEAARLINKALVIRLSRYQGSRGQSNTPRPIIADLTVAAKREVGEISPQDTMATYATYRLAVQEKTGLLMENTWESPRISEAGSARRSPSESPLPRPSRMRTRAQTIAQTPSRQIVIRSQPTSAGSPGERRAQILRESGDTRMAGTSPLSAGSQRERGSQPNSPAESMMSTASDYQPPSRESMARSITTMQQREPGCNCHPTVPARFYSHIAGHPPHNEAEELKTLAEYIAALNLNRRDNDVCYMHTKKVAGDVGLKTRSPTHQELIRRLREMHLHRGDLFAFKTSPVISTWWRKDRRPPVPSDELGPYRFFPTMPPRIQYLSATMVADIDRTLGFLPNDKQAWESRGTINFGKVFDWWGLVGDGNRRPIINGVKEEYDMYQWHQRERMGEPNRGWLRSMVYGVGQQLMRMDIGYYMLYARLRPDNAAWLVSYPYYAKYQRKGEQTAFRHIDLNVREMISGARGINQIQGTLSLDDEKNDDCTEIVPGMHKTGKLQHWMELLQQRGQPMTDGRVQNITKEVLSPQDLKTLKTQWEKVPCKALQVRVSMPHLPHGAIGPSQRVRRTMLPWFVGIAPNHEALEGKEGGKWSELSEAHRDMVAPPRTPSGLANKYAIIPYRFPASVRLQGLGPVSDALVGQRKWTDPEVIQEQQIIFGNPDGARLHLQKWRKNAYSVASKAWETIQRMEEQAFREKSYYNNGKDFRSRPAGDESSIVEQSPEDEEFGPLDGVLRE